MIGFCSYDYECKGIEKCVDGFCREQTICSPGEPRGVCPELDGESYERECLRWACVPPGWCKCNASGEGCLNNGSCFSTFSPLSQCSANNQTGDCYASEVCVGGTCVPIVSENVCAFDRTRGICLRGLACELSSGFCQEISDRPCNATNAQDGLCPAGQRCFNGTCTRVECSAQEPFGACPLGQMCIDGTCQQVLCSPSNPAGAGRCKDSSLTGTRAGRCMKAPECIDDKDCTTAQKCSKSGGICIATNACLGDSY